MENSQSIIYTLLPDGTFTFISPSWKTNLGHETPDVTGHNFREFIHPEDIPKCEEFLRRAIDSRTMQTSVNDYRIFHRDGSVHWHRSSVMPIFEESGSLLFFVGNAVDMTDRKHAEDALRESQAELHSILHGSPVLQFVISRDHRVLAWNRALEQYSGIPSAKVIGTDQQWRAFYREKRPVLADLLVDNNRDGLYKWYGGKLKESRYVEGAYEIVDFFPAMGDAGTWLSFTAAPVRNADGLLIGAVETLEDISERIEAEDALKKSMEEYRNILENMQDAYIRIDEHNTVTMVNPSAVRMYGYASEEEMIGIPSSALYAGGTAVQETVLKKLEESGRVVDFSGVAPRKDGTQFGVSLNLQFIRDAAGNIQGAEAIVRDISERRAMEQAIREANQKLNLLNSITRHDIVNQLTMIQGFTQIATMKAQDPVIIDYLAKISTGASTINRQIEFTKTYQDLGVRTPGWFRIEEMIAKIAPVNVTCSDTCQVTEIFADPMLEKVFFNLFENSLRHGERVTEIHTLCEQVPEGLRIIVEDNGVGIPMDEKERIFEKGFGKNTGLGLFLVKEILAITGITIRETGIPGQGARFEILVPKGQYRLV